MIFTTECESDSETEKEYIWLQMITYHYLIQ